MKKKLLLLMLCLLGASSSMVSADDVETEAYKVYEQDVYRLYNKESNQHFYTKNMEEVLLLTSRGWRDEGYAFSFGQNGETVHRLFNPKEKEYFFTVHQEEIDYLKSKGWYYEGLAFNSYGSVPVYRMFHKNINKHFYTRHLSEYQSSVEKGYKQEGIAYYTLGAGEDALSKRTSSAEVKRGNSDTDRIHLLDRFESASEMVLLESNGRFGLLDAGYQNKKAHDYAINYLKALGVKELDFVVLTHYDEDHWTFLNTRKKGEVSSYKIFKDTRNIEPAYLGSTELLDNFKINKVIARPADTNVYYEPYIRKEIEATLTDYKIPISFEKELMLGDYKLTLFNDYPLSEAEYKRMPRPISNYNSLAVLVEKGQFNFLFSGDVEEDDEAQLAEDLYHSGNRTIHLMTAGHHGLGTSNTKDYLDFIGNPTGLISYSEKRIDPKGRINIQGFQDRYFYGDGTVLVDLTSLSSGVKITQRDTGRSSVLSGNF